MLTGPVARRMKMFCLVRNVMTKFLTPTDIILAMFSPDLPVDVTAARLYTILSINLQTTSASRIGALVRASSYEDPKYDLRGLCWQDLDIWIFRGEARPYNRIRIDFTLRFTKTDQGRVGDQAMDQADPTA